VREALGRWDPLRKALGPPSSRVRGRGTVRGALGSPSSRVRLSPLLLDGVRSAMLWDLWDLWDLWVYGSPLCMRSAPGFGARVQCGAVRVYVSHTAVRVYGIGRGVGGGGPCQRPAMCHRGRVAWTRENFLVCPGRGSNPGPGAYQA
jgi:hypothetical protein